MWGRGWCWLSPVEQDCSWASRRAAGSHLSCADRLRAELLQHVRLQALRW